MEPQGYCVYSITCIENGRKYIGQTVNFEKRCYNHMITLERGKHVNSVMQGDYQRFGKAAFVFEIIEWCPTKDMTLNREAELMSQYAIQNRTYNAVIANPEKSSKRRNPPVKEYVSLEVWREKAGISQKQLADTLSQITRSKITGNHVAAWERGSMPGWDSGEAISTLTGGKVTPASFVKEA